MVRWWRLRSISAPTEISVGPGEPEGGAGGGRGRAGGTTRGIDAVAQHRHRFGRRAEAQQRRRAAPALTVISAAARPIAS